MFCSKGYMVNYSYKSEQLMPRNDLNVPVGALILIRRNDHNYLFLTVSEVILFLFVIQIIQFLSFMIIFNINGIIT